MTFQQLTYVVEVSKCGSINKAAHKLFLSQSGISTAVRELEQELGIQFFTRSNRGVEFTPEGREFLGYAVSLLEQKQRIQELYKEDRSATAPAHFNVSSQRYPFTDDAFIETLRHTEDGPYHFTIKDTSMEDVISDVYERRADVGVIFLSKMTEKIIRHLLDSRELVFHELASIPPCVFIRRDHPLAHLERLPSLTSTDIPTSVLSRHKALPWTSPRNFSFSQFGSPPSASSSTITLPPSAFWPIRTLSAPARGCW